MKPFSAWTVRSHLLPAAPTYFLKCSINFHQECDLSASGEWHAVGLSSTPLSPQRLHLIIANFLQNSLGQNSDRDIIVVIIRTEVLEYCHI